jgi:hypothetical protein
MEPVDAIPVYLHVPVHGASSVKFRSNYWLLQPWYINQEMWAGLLHVYNSAFSYGDILRGVGCRRSIQYCQWLRRPRASLPGQFLKTDLKSRINNTGIHEYLASTV